jgi:hypothetical protein
MIGVTRIQGFCCHSKQAYPSVVSSEVEAIKNSYFCLEPFFSRFCLKNEIKLTTHPISVFNDKTRAISPQFFGAILSNSN